MRRFGLIGKHITYSFSPGYFREKFALLGFEDCAYDIFDLSEISALPDLIENCPDLRGLNVTSPYKEAVIPYLDHMDPEADLIGAVNTIRISENKLLGYNTDVVGFMESLAPLLRKNDRAALILGTGGASKAVARGLEQLGIAYRFVSRHPGPGLLTYEDLDTGVMEQFQILVNCTPLGTAPRIEASPPIPYEGLGPTHLLYDLIYNPGQTTFLSRGAQMGARTKNGLEMLRIQAEASWEIWNR